MKYKIIVFSKLFWPEGSGGELATYLITKDILCKYFEVIVVSGTKNLPFLSCSLTYWSLLKGKAKPLKLLKVFSSTYVIRNLIKGADIVYIPSHTLLPLAIIVKRICPEIKVIVHLHNYQPISYTSVVFHNDSSGDFTRSIKFEILENRNFFKAIASSFMSLFNIINKMSLYYTDKIICVSKKQQEILIKALPELRDKTVVVYNPLPPIRNYRKTPAPIPTFLYLGGSSYIKGFHLFVKATHKILKRGYKAKFLITKDLKTDDINLIKKLNKIYGNAFTYKGRIAYDEVLRLYEEAWASVFPSLYEEPLPYAIMESMLTGTIPISSKIGGVPEIVQGTYAEKMLFKPEDVNELVDRIEGVLSMSKEQLTDIGAGLREAVLKRFDEDNIKKQLLEVFGNNGHSS